jgi:hypothetical protein
MAACVIGDKITAAACYSNGALTEKQQKLALLYFLYSWGVTIGSGVPATVGGLTEFAKCWQPLTDSQLLGVDIITTKTISTSTATVANVLSSTSCISALSDQELDRIIGAIKCSILATL